MTPPYIEIVAPRFLIALSRLAPIHITLWPLIVGRVRMIPVVAQHEAIHAAQQFECWLLVCAAAVLLGIGLHPVFLVLIPLGLPAGWPVFAPLYYGAYALTFVKYRHTWRRHGEALARRWSWSVRNDPTTLGEVAYLAIPFEQEAYACEAEPGYLRNRRPFAWLGYWP